MELDDVRKTRATSRAARRGSSSLASAQLRVLGVELDQDERSHLRRRLAMKLRRNVQRRRMKPIRGRHNRRSPRSGVPRTAK